MSWAWRRGHAALLVVPDREDATVGDLVEFFIGGAGATALRRGGVDFDPAAREDRSTHITTFRLHTVRHIDAHPCEHETISVSADRETGRSYLRIDGRRSLVRLAVPALADLREAVALRFPRSRTIAKGELRNLPTDEKEHQ